jgi:hypothetical protein
MVTGRSVVMPALALALTHSACARPAPAAHRDHLDPAEASAQVSVLLYQQGLVSDPEVNAKMNEYVLAVSRDGVPVDSVMPEFHHWLEAWARAHPDRAAAARLAPAPASR